MHQYISKQLLDFFLKTIIILREIRNQFIIEKIVYNWERFCWEWRSPRDQRVSRRKGCTWMWLWIVRPQRLRSKSQSQLNQSHTFRSEC